MPGAAAEALLEGTRLQTWLPLFVRGVGAQGKQPEERQGGFAELCPGSRRRLRVFGAYDTVNGEGA